MKAKTIEQMIDALTSAWTYSREYWEKMSPRMVEYYYEILYYGN